MIWQKEDNRPPRAPQHFLQTDSATIEVGDWVGDFQVTSITPFAGDKVSRDEHNPNIKITFSGDVVLRGYLYVEPDGELHIIAALRNISKPSTPLPDGLTEGGTLYISNPEIRDANVTSGDQVEVQLATYVVGRYPSDSVPYQTAISIKTLEGESKESRYLAEATHVSPNGYEFQVPANTTVIELPATGGYSPATSVRGDFGVICISPGYSCGGEGLQGWTSSEKTITSASGHILKMTIWEQEGNMLYGPVSVTPLPSEPWTTSGQIQLSTTRQFQNTAEAILASLRFK